MSVERHTIRVSQPLHIRVDDDGLDVWREPPDVGHAGCDLTDYLGG